MNPKNTGLWLLLAAGLFAFIFFYQRHARRADAGPPRILPALNASTIDSIQVLPRGRELEIRARRVNDSWQLTEPLVYPAQSASIENLLGVLQQLTAATFITERELKNRFNADEEFGFATPQASLILQPGDFRLRLGKKTAPGDQVFLQIVGLEGVYVVDAELLKFIPEKASAWRDTTFMNLKGLTFDRLAITNGATIFVLQRDATNRLWRLLYPIQARADNARLEDALQKLQGFRIHEFLSDDPKADLEPLGLQPPQLELALAQGTNPVALLQFGQMTKSNTNDVCARRFGQNTIVSVSKELLAPWQRPYTDFRDSHLLSLNSPLDMIEVRAQEAFSLQRQTSSAWCVFPHNFRADAAKVKEMFASLMGLQVVEFAKDFVTDPDLPTYGLAAPSRQYTLISLVTNSTVGLTNSLSFGTNHEDKIFARRADESSVYAVKFDEVQRLPTAGWQLRERQIWDCSENDIARVGIRQDGKTRQLVHQAQYKWSLAPGSQGIIDELAVEETMRGICHLAALAWVALGEQQRARYGFTADGLQLAIDLKSGEKMNLEFGGQSPSGLPYAAVTLEGQLWIFEFPPALHRDVAGALGAH